MEMHQKDNTIVIKINNAIHYIENNTHKKLVLKEIAKQAYLSPFHFHRIFTAIVGETLHSFIIRKKIEKAARLLLHKPNEFTITEIGEAVGFNSLTSFSRAFKKFYGLAPKTFRQNTPSRFSKICKTESKNGIVNTELQQYIYNFKTHLNFIEMNAKKIEVTTVEAITVAYVSHIGNPEKLEQSFDILLKWAYPNNLFNEKTKVITVYHDSPKITAISKLRMSACISLSEDNITIPRDINTTEIIGGRHVIARYEISPHQFENAWEATFVWLFDKGFKVKDNPPFEIYHNDFRAHPEQKVLVDLHIPVE